MSHDHIAPSNFIVNLSRIDKYAPEKLIGRESEFKILHDAWAQVQAHAPKRPHILTFVALGGEGKTSLVAKWAAELAHQDWPGCDAVFAWSFYSQGTRDQTAASSDLFLKEALTFFGNDEDKAFAASPARTHEKGQRLARIVGQKRNLLILDGLEPLQYAPTSPTPGQLKDQGLSALLKGLAANNHGLCIVTTRYSIPDLKTFWQSTAQEVKLLRLSREAGVHLLKALDVHGTAKEFETLVEDLKGHALTLNILGSYLRDAHGGDIRKHNLVKIRDADAENEHARHAFHVMDAYVRWLTPKGIRAWLRRIFSVKERESYAAGRLSLQLLQLLGLFDRPAAADCLSALWKAPAIPGLTDALVGTSDPQRNVALKRLEDAKLLTVNREAPTGTLLSLDAHPLIREYFAVRLRTQQSVAYKAGHKRLYEHLCDTTKEGDQPTLEDLQPLYQAVAHGCQAGLQQDACVDVYRGRINRNNEFYSVYKLGAFGSDLGAVACFFEQPWTRVSFSLTEADQAWVLHQTAFHLRALGRLTEALEPMRSGLAMHTQQEDWEQAATSAGNLSEMELTLGDVAGAVNDATQSVAYADRSGDAFERLCNRTTHADALHQAGRWTEAETLFREAEHMQAERQPEYPLLSSLQGFQYCDLLLCGSGFQPVPRKEHRKESQQSLKGGATEFRAVAQRATQTLKIAEANNWLLDIAINHLTLGRTALYEALLNSPPYDFSVARSELDAAVSGLRRAGQQDELPRGLLTRAQLRFLTGARTGPDSAQSDLDEAWEIAERGPMRLHMADIHLYRARLFFREPIYPWATPENPNDPPRTAQDDLNAAKKLIDSCGYHRRDEELADAQEALAEHLNSK